MPLGMEVNFGSGDLVLDRDPAPPPQKGGRAPKFSSHVYCRQTAGWIKMALGMEVGLSPSDFVVDGYSAPPRKRGGAPNSRPKSVVVRQMHGSRCHLVRR